MEEKRFEIVPPGKQVLLLPLLSATAVMVALAFALTQGGQRTPLPPVAFVAFAAVPLLAGLIALDMFRRDVRLTEAGLRLRTLPWRSTVRLDELDLDRAEIVDLSKRPELLPRIKIAGARLPGYTAGLFWLRDKRRGSVLVTDRSRVLLLPRRNGSVILLSLQHPDALLEALRRRRG